MIDIQGELLRLRQQREQEYISIVELLNYLKNHNPNSSYIDIATYLLVRLTPNDIRKTDDEVWGDEEFEYWMDQNGIAVFEVPSKIDEQVKNLYPYLFFEALETVRDFDDIPPDILGNPDRAEEYLREDQLRLYIKRKRIEELLNIDTVDQTKAEAELIEQQTVAVAMALTKTEEFIKNTDINKSPVGTAERAVFQQHLAEKDKIIEELQNKLNIQAVMPVQLQENEAEPKGRISQPQRDIFTLLTVKNYPNCQSRNELFNSINADLKAQGIISSDIKYPTLDRLIDEEIRLEQEIEPGKRVKKSPFPPKQK